MGRMARACRQRSCGGSSARASCLGPLQKSCRGKDTGKCPEKIAGATASGAQCSSGAEGEEERGRGRGRLTVAVCSLRPGVIPQTVPHGRAPARFPHLARLVYPCVLNAAHGTRGMADSSEHGDTHVHTHRCMLARTCATHAQLYLGSWRIGPLAGSTKWHTQPSTQRAGALPESGENTACAQRSSKGEASTRQYMD